MPNAATLPLLLKQLALPSMYANWETAAKQAEKNHWSYPEYLTVLSDQEAVIRQQKRIQRHLKESKLPPGKTLDSYDFTATQSVNAAQITALADNTNWVSQANNVVIFGPSGVGKTHLASAIAHRLVQQGVRSLFVSTTSIVQKLQAARGEYKLQEIINKLARYPLLILDDFGYVKKVKLKLAFCLSLLPNAMKHAVYLLPLIKHSVSGTKFFLIMSWLWLQSIVLCTMQPLSTFKGKVIDRKMLNKK